MSNELNATQQPGNKQWIVEIFERAEHWTFEARYVAPSADAARRMAITDYTHRAYNVRRISRGDW
jgi:hypothetical protein